jgi:hypothetical protein
LADLENLILSHYDGYSWDGINRVLNPFSLIKSFNENKLKSYWSGTGNPTFLMKLIRENPLEYIEAETYPMSETILDAVDIYNVDLVPLLFQSGYLTIDRLATTEEGLVSDEDYILRSPNLEVNKVFGNIILEAMTSLKEISVTKVSNMIKKALTNLDSTLLAQAFREILTWPRCFVHIPYERYYQTIFHLVLKSLNYKVKAEENTYKGRTDIGIYFGKNTFFLVDIKHKKLDDPEKVSEADKAEYLAQLLSEGKEQVSERDYAHDYENDGLKVKKLAIAIVGRETVSAEFF